MAHSHDHHVPKQLNTAFALAIALNLLFTFAEAFYASLANSMSLMGDAVHNLGDVLGLLIAWGANWLLSKPCTNRYSYGYKRTTIIAAIINAFILIASAAIIAYESIEKLISPSTTHELTVIIVAAVGIIINGGTALLFIKGSHDDLNIKGAFLHLATDALISVGVVFAGVIMLLCDWQWLDPVGGLLIVGVILYSTWELCRDSVLLLLDGVPYKIDYHEVKQYFLSLDNVASLHDLHIWGLSTKEIALTAHLVMPEGSLADNDYERINKHLLEKFHIGHVTIQVEKGNDNNCQQANTCHQPSPSP